MPSRSRSSAPLGAFQTPKSVWHATASAPDRRHRAPRPPVKPPRACAQSARRLYGGKSSRVGKGLGHPAKQHHAQAPQRQLLATRSAATCRNHGAVPAVHHIQTRTPRHQVRHGAQTEAVGWHRGRRWFARVELAKPSKICGGCGSTARPPLGAKLGSF